MALNPTLRSSQTTPLTQLQADNNWLLLARDATKTQQGNVEIATQAETNSLSSEVLAVSPSTLASIVNTLADARIVAATLTGTTLGSKSSIPAGTNITITDKSAYEHISVLATNNGVTTSFYLPGVGITNGMTYSCPTFQPGSSGQGGGLRFKFSSNTNVNIVHNDSGDGDRWDSIIISGYRY